MHTISLTDAAGLAEASGLTTQPSTAGSGSATWMNTNATARQVATPSAFRRDLCDATTQQPIDKLGSAGEPATTLANDGLAGAQLKHELALAYTDLGGATFALAYHGAVIDRRLASRVQRIRELDAQLRVP